MPHSTPKIPDEFKVERKITLDKALLEQIDEQRRNQPKEMATSTSSFGVEHDRFGRDEKKDRKKS